MEKLLQGKKIAILATNGFEQAELLEPREALDKQGARTQVISPEKGKIHNGRPAARFSGSLRF